MHVCSDKLSASHYITLLLDLKSEKTTEEKDRKSKIVAQRLKSPEIEALVEILKLRVDGLWQLVTTNQRY